MPRLRGRTWGGNYLLFDIEAKVSGPDTSYRKVTNKGLAARDTLPTAVRTPIIMPCRTRKNSIEDDKKRRYMSVEIVSPGPPVEMAPAF